MEPASFQVVKRVAVSTFWAVKWDQVIMPRRTYRACSGNSLTLKGSLSYSSSREWSRRRPSRCLKRRSMPAKTLVKAKSMKSLSSALKTLTWTRRSWIWMSSERWAFEASTSPRWGGCHPVQSTKLASACQLSTYLTVTHKSVTTKVSAANLSWCELPISCKLMRASQLLAVSAGCRKIEYRQPISRSRRRLIRIKPPSSPAGIVLSRSASKMSMILD